MSDRIQLKNANRIAVLNYIRRNIHTTKSGLSAACGLTFMAIQKIMEEFMELGLVRTDKLCGGETGRKAVTYTIDENFAYTAGLHINMFKTTAAVMNLHGDIMAVEEIDMAHVPGNSAGLIDLMAEAIGRVIEKSKIEPHKLLGLGIGAPGPVNPTEGMILSPPNLPFLRYLPICKIMAEKLNTKVLLCKDTNSIALGEYWRGSGSGHDSMVYVDADMGIGSGLIQMGELQEGHNFTAGEFGHITIDSTGPMCNCGNRGCLESMASGIAILREARRQLADQPNHPLAARLDDLTIQEFLQAGAAGDLTAISILNQSAYHMGGAIASLINILDPSVVIIGGFLAREYEPYLSIVCDTVLQRRLAGTRENPVIHAKCGRAAGVIGAGELVSSNFFSALRLAQK